MADEDVPTKNTVGPNLATEGRRLVRFFDLRNINKNCWICDTGNWFSVDDLLTVTSIGLMQGRAHPTYTLICANCGLVRQHDRAVVDTALIEQGLFEEPVNE